MARGTRALPGAAGLRLLIDIRTRRPAGLVGLRSPSRPHVTPVLSQKSALPSVRLQDWLKHLPNIGGHASVAFDVGMDLVGKVEFRATSHAVEKERD